MKNIKRTCLFLLCTLLLALLLPSLAGAADSDFQITNGVLTKYTGPGGDVVVPEGVTSIGGGAFGECESLTSIVLPEGVTSIGDYAFYWCTSLTSVVIPEGVTNIKDYAFGWCFNLTSVTLPSTLETLGESVFTSCDKLTSIKDKSGKFLKTVDGIVYSTDGTQMIAVLASASGEIHIADGVTEIPGWMFGNNDKITAVVIPEGVTRIGDNAFCNCSILTDIVIPEGVTSIGWGAFSYCNNLISVTLPSTMEDLGESAFGGCYNLTNLMDKSGKFAKNVDGIVYSADGTQIIAVLTSASGEIHIAEGVTEIPASLFENNDRITGIVIPEGVTSIGNLAFNSCNSLTSIVLPEGVTSIWDYAFAGCSYLTSVTLPSTLETLGEGVFEGCNNLASIEDKSGKFLKTVDGIVYSADGTRIIAVLASASGEIHIAEGVTEIPSSLFYGNSRITSVVIPEGVTSIGDGAFSNCNNLTSVTLPSTLETLGEDVFNRCDNLTSIEDKSGRFLKTVDGIVYSADGTQIIVVLTSASGEIHIAEGVTEISYGLFNVSGITSIVIPEGVTNIGDWAFGWCDDLTSVTLPSTLETLGESAFASCNKLTSIVDKSGKFTKNVDGIVYTPDGTRMIAVLASASGEVRIAKGVTEIPTFLFINNNRITGVVIPEGVTNIGNQAFGWCDSLTSVVIPEGVTRIGYGAFKGSENLTSVTLPSTLNDIGKEAFPASTIIRSEPNTYAHTWALKNGYTWQPAGQSESKVMKLPAGLKSIQQEAFRGSAAESIVLPDGCTEIGAKAFADCSMLRRVEIPASVAVIAEDAFEGCSNELVIVTPKGSAAESFAQAHGLSVTYAEP